MTKLKLKTAPGVDDVFANYPDHIREKLLNLRRLLLEAADESAEIESVEETLKWGEPSYLTKKGSTVRMDWKPKTPDQYALYFKCTSKLVSTFKMVFGDLFRYEGERAIIFKQDEKMPEAELKKCMAIALTYHKVKHLPYLGLG